MAAKNKSNELKITRIYDAPVKTVWNAWADPKQAAKWWGPRGWSITTHDKDLRTGGHWTYTMHGPDGVNIVNKTKYLEVDQYKRMVYDHGGNDMENRPALFRVTVVFSEVNGKTKQEMSMAFATPEVAEQMKGFIKQANGHSTWDRLGEYLEKESSGKETFVINRSFDAPIETVYEMWSNPKHFSKWLPPTGFDMQIIRSEIKPGGTTFWVMSGTGHGGQPGQGMTKMYGKIKYLEFQKPDRILYTQQFCDENEKISRHPMLTTWPETMLTTVKFTSEGPEQTRVTVTWEVQGQASREEIETFVKERAGMTQGWTGSFDKLEAYLTEAR